MATLYHGSAGIITEIKDQGLFGGLFAGGKEAALSHGDMLHIIEIDDSDVLTQSHLEYDADFVAVKAVIAQATRCESEEDEEIAWAVVVEDKCAHDFDEETVCLIFRSDDAGEASWEAQRIRGLIAKALGFKAVEMNDEHGTTYLVLPGANIRGA